MGFRGEGDRYLDTAHTIATTGTAVGANRICFADLERSPSMLLTSVADAP
jgi:hypothetical protein